MSTRPLRLGIAGLGRAFSLMLPTFTRHPLVEVIAGADPRPEARARFSEDFTARVYESVAELCRDPAVEVVYVSTPHQFHAEHACTAAANGKHVLVEKPMALTRDECSAMIAAAKSAGVQLVVGHSHSFDAPIRRTREIIENGAVGRLRMIAAMNYTDFLYRLRRPEELDTERGGGVLFNQAPHQVDVVRLLAGGRVRSVRASVGRWDSLRPTEGAYSALLTFEDGVFATLTYSGYGHFDSDEFCDWIGESGMPKDPTAYGEARRILARASSTEETALKNARNYGSSRQIKIAAGPTKPYHQHFGVVVASCDHADLRSTSKGVAIYDDAERRFEVLPPPEVPRAEVIEELHAAIASGVRPVHDGAWGLATMEVCLAMQRSAAEGREITLQNQVTLPSSGICEPAGAHVAPASFAERDRMS